MIFLLLLYTTSKIFLIADDTKCLSPVRSIPDCLPFQRDLNDLATWSLRWKLDFNAHKCALVRFFYRNSSLIYRYTIKGLEVVAQDSHKDLGIVLSQDLSWSEHKIYFIKVLQNPRTHSKVIQPRIFTLNKKILYLSIYRSQLPYGSQVWRPHRLKDIMP